MNEEIKEILNQLETVGRKHTIEICEDGSKIETMPASVVNELRLNNYSAKLLLDYITNLQNENKELKKRNNEIYDGFMATNKELCDVNNRINKAIEYIKTCNPNVDLNSMFLNENYISNYGANDLLKILGGDE